MKKRHDANTKYKKIFCDYINIRRNRSEYYQFSHRVERAWVLKAVRPAVQPCSASDTGQKSDNKTYSILISLDESSLILTKPYKINTLTPIFSHPVTGGNKYTIHYSNGNNYYYSCLFNKFL